MDDGEVPRQPHRYFEMVGHELLKNRRQTLRYDYLAARKIRQALW
jgi:hypothetical protein